MGGEGLEYIAKRPINTPVSKAGGALSGALSGDFSEDSQLRAILAAWPSLTRQARAAIEGIATNPASKAGL